MPFKRQKSSQKNNLRKSVPPAYLVHSPQCKMLSLEPLAPDVMQMFSKMEFEPCSKKHALTSIEQNFKEDTVKLILHRDFESEFLSSDQNQIDCCFHEITRAGFKFYADEKFK
jgi:hypothetical protein